MARSELECPKDPVINGTGNASTETMHQGATSNGVAKAVVHRMATSMSVTTSISLVHSNLVPENRETKLKVKKEIWKESNLEGCADNTIGRNKKTKNIVKVC